LTAPPQLQPAQSPSSPAFWGRTRALPGGKGHLGPAFSAAPEADDQTSDALCRPPLSPSVMPGSCEGPRTASTALRQQDGFPGPKRLLIDMCVAHIRRHRPPPIARLCRRAPASGARSPPRCSRTEWLDPPRLRGLFARAREDHAPHVNLCNQKRSLSTTAMIDRTPLTAPRVAPERSSMHAVKTACAA
jgi:hypothetical protein